MTLRDSRLARGARGDYMRTVILVSLALFAAISSTTADTIRQPRIVDVTPEPEGIGCYWKLGRRFCSRYCYWEVDGRRYCHIREREAYPQGPAPQIVYVPMKLDVRTPSPGRH